MRRTNSTVVRAWNYGISIHDVVGGEWGKGGKERRNPTSFIPLVLCGRALKGVEWSIFFSHCFHSSNII